MIAAYNHSGRSGALNFLRGVMGIANAQRVLNYIRIITEFISQPEYQGLIPVFSVLNEPLLVTITKPVLGHLSVHWNTYQRHHFADLLSLSYLETHRMIREITGTGAGNGPYICIHDGFLGTGEFAGFLSGSDRIILDTHPYFAFNGASNTEPIGVDGRGDTWPARACGWAAGMDAR
jgi:glucan 1,3-beta-glucosidase